MRELDLSTFDNSTHDRGRSLLVQSLWFFFGLPILRCPVLPSSAVRRFVLRVFGARVGVGVVLKPGVRVKYPWFLSIGDHSWIGEDCWIDNLVPVTIGTECCVSQGVYLCTGNHDWSDRGFAYRLGGIVIEDGAWIGAKSVVCPGVTVARLAVLAAGSVARANIPEKEIHSGNPAIFLKYRSFRDDKETASVS